MFRFALVIFLVAAAVSTSGKHVKKTRREVCSWSGNPYYQCFLGNVDDYPTLFPLQRTSNMTDAKKILKEHHSFENLCSESTRLYNCLSSAVDTLSEECREEFQDDKPKYEKTLSYIAQLCTEDNIAIARENLDCLTNEDRLADMRDCFLKDWNIDCSTDEVIECIVEKVAKPCGEGAERPTTIIARLYFLEVPLC